MAHPCCCCGGECHCHGDVDDCVVSLTPTDCRTCGCNGSGRWDDAFEDYHDPDGLDYEYAEDE